MADKTLNLSTTEFERPAVRIDGTLYSLRAHAELSVLDIKEQARLGAIIQRFAGRTATDGIPSEEELDEYVAALRKSVGIISLDIPEEVIDGLPAGMWGQLLKHYRTFKTASSDAKPESPTN